MEDAAGSGATNIIIPNEGHDETDLANVSIVSEVVESSDNRGVLHDFIKLYESLPELWDPSNASYQNKKRRNAALDRLVDVYSKIKPNPSRFDVRRKINTLRSNYRKDLSRMIASKRLGTDVYQPSSWVFHALQFLKNTVASKGLQESNNEDPSDGNSARITRPIKKRRVLEHNTKQFDLLSLACEYLAKNKHSRTSDSDYLDTAKVWANKLKELEPCQRLLAEKAINDILFEARLNNLKKDSVKINQDSNVTYAGMYLSTEYLPAQSSE